MLKGSNRKIEKSKQLKQLPEHKYLIIDMTVHCWSFLYAYLFNNFGVDFANLVRPIIVKENQKSFIRLVFKIPKTVKLVRIRNDHVKRVELTFTKPSDIKDELILEINNVEQLKVIIRGLNIIASYLT